MPLLASSAVPGCAVAIALRQRLEAVGVVAQERPVEHAPRAARLLLEHRLHDALEQRHVAADAHLQVEVRDRGAAAEPGERLLRVREAHQAALAQRVDRDDARAAPLGGLQRGQHARVVRARVLADHEDRVGALEVLEARPCPCRRRSPRRARRRSIRDTGSSSRADCWCRSRARRAATGTRPRCWCVPRCRRRPRRAIRGRAARARCRANAASHDDRRDSGRSPARGSSGSIEAALLLEPVVALREQLRDRPRARRRRRRAARAGRLVRDRLGAVLAELGRGALARIGPRAAGAVEAARLVHARGAPRARAARRARASARASRERAETAGRAASAGRALRASGSLALCRSAAPPRAFGCELAAPNATRPCRRTR